MAWIPVDVTGSDPQIEVDCEFTPYVAFRDDAMSRPIGNNVEHALTAIEATIIKLVREVEGDF